LPAAEWRESRLKVALALLGGLKVAIALLGKVKVAFSLC
jgi:hypothetical protein